MKPSKCEKTTWKLREISRIVDPSRRDSDNRKICAWRSLEFEGNTNVKEHRRKNLSRALRGDAINRPLAMDRSPLKRYLNITWDPIVAKASSRTTMEYITRSSLRNDRSALSFSLHPFTKLKSRVRVRCCPDRAIEKLDAENIRCAKSESCDRVTATESRGRNQMSRRFPKRMLSRGNTKNKLILSQDNTIRYKGMMRSWLFSLCVSLFPLKEILIFMWYIYGNRVGKKKEMYTNR